MENKNHPSAQNNLYTNCPVVQTLEIFGGKWKPVILWEMERGSFRFGELRRAIPEITQKMLTQQLRELEKDGVIWRKVYAEVPPHVEYGVTEYGKTLRPILDEMARWGLKHQKRKQEEEDKISLDKPIETLIFSVDN